MAISTRRSARVHLSVLKNIRAYERTYVRYVRTYAFQQVRTYALPHSWGLCERCGQRKRGAPSTCARTSVRRHATVVAGVLFLGFPPASLSLRACVRAYSLLRRSLFRLLLESYARTCVRTCAHLVSPPSPQRRARHGRFHHRQLPRRDEELPRSSEDQWREQCTKECRKLTQFFSRGFNHHEFEHLSEAIDYVKNEIHEWGWHNASNQAMVRDLGQKFQKRFESPGDISSRLPGGAITRTGPKSRSSGTSSK